MIDIKAARAGLADIVQTALPDLSVQRAGFDAVASFPTIVVGMPTWAPDDKLPYQFQRHTWPIAVVVGRGSQDSATIDQLDSLWPDVLGVLRTASEQDGTLGGICAESLVLRADFGQFAIQGTSYPAQLVQIDLYG